MMPDYQPVDKIEHENKFVTLCAWCDSSKKLTEYFISMGYRTSHGICLRHRDDVLKEWEKTYKEFI